VELEYLDFKGRVMEEIEEISEIGEPFFRLDVTKMKSSSLDGVDEETIYNLKITRLLIRRRQIKKHE
jgi:hypothetical protein